MSRVVVAILAALFCVLAGSDVASAFNANQTFARGSLLLSVEGGYGDQFSLLNDRITDLQFVNAGVRLGWLPFGVAGSAPVRGAVELGLEPFYQAFGGDGPKRLDQRRELVDLVQDRNDDRDAVRHPRSRRG